MAKTVIMRKQDGRVTFDQELAYLFSTLANGTYSITVKKVQEKRSIAQNDLMWMWLTCIQNETGTNKDEIYMYYCKKFLMKTVSVGQKMERIYMTTSKLNSEQMSEFLNKVQADALSELGIRLPTPQDRFWEAFYQDYK